MTRWICPECGRECAIAEQVCPICAGGLVLAAVAAGSATQELAADQVSSSTRRLAEAVEGRGSAAAAAPEPCAAGQPGMREAIAVDLGSVQEVLAVEPVAIAAEIVPDPERVAISDPAVEQAASAPEREPAAVESLAEPAVEGSAAHTPEPAVAESLATPTLEPEAAEGLAAPTLEPATGEALAAPEPEPVAAESLAAPTLEPAPAEGLAAHMPEPAAADGSAAPEPEAAERLAAPTLEPAAAESLDAPTLEPAVEGSAARTPEPAPAEGLAAHMPEPAAAESLDAPTLEPAVEGSAARAPEPAAADRFSVPTPQPAIPSSGERGLGALCPTPFSKAGSPAIPSLPMPDRFPIVKPELAATPPIPEVRAGRFPTWIISVVVATVVFLAVASSVQKFMSSPDAQPVSAATTGSKSQAPDPLEGETEYPFARLVEVTGLRVVEQNDRSQVQYLVVNHSENTLTDIGLRIAVRSAASEEGSTPLFSVTARVPTLAPHESKEIRTDLDSHLKATQIPDWVNLRTSVKVIAQQ